MIHYKTAKETETDIKEKVKEYLAIRDIYSFPLLQGLGAHPGLPDRVMHLNGEVHYLEIKKPKGKLSPGQLEFQQQCKFDDVAYHVIRSVEDLQGIVEVKLSR